MKVLGILEIVVGLLLVVVSSYILVQSAMFPATDRHGLGLGLGLFGASFGALLAFAGAALATRSKWSLPAHFPLIAYSAVIYITWTRAYA